MNKTTLEYNGKTYMCLKLLSDWWSVNSFKWFSDWSKHSKVAPAAGLLLKIHRTFILLSSGRRFCLQKKNNKIIEQDPC